MDTHSIVNQYTPSNFSRFGQVFDQPLNLLRRVLFTGLLVSLIWLLELSSQSVLAMPISAAMPASITSQVFTSAVEGDRMVALITCLPKQLSRPSLKRSLNEMGNDQLERAFNLKAKPKLSQAEIDLANCLNRQ